MKPIHIIDNSNKEVTMAKRFTDTALYDKKWFMRLSTKHKCLWEYIRTKCDHAGILDINLDLASLQIGERIELSDFHVFGDRIVFFDEDKIFLVGFIKFQYGTLNEKINAHKSVLSILSKYNLNGYLTLDQDLNQDGFKGSSTLKTTLETDQSYPYSRVMDKDKDKDNNTIYINKSLYAENDTMNSDDWSEKINQDSIIAMFNSICAGKGKIKPFRSYFFSQNMIDEFFKITGDPLFRKIETWQEAFDTVAQSQFLTQEFNTTLNWILNHDNLQKILSGQYQTRTEPQKSLKNDPMNSGNESDKLFDRILSAGRNGLGELKKELTVLEFRVIQDFGSMLEIYNATTHDIPRVKKKFRDCYIETMKKENINEQTN